MAAVLAALLFVPNCGNFGYSSGLGPQGGIYSSTRMTTSINTDVPADNLKEGEVCQSRIWFFAAYGGGTVRDVAEEAQINQIRSVNKELLNVLGLYSRQCTIVTGI